ATPRYTAAGCAGAFHRSAIVVGAGSGVTALEDLRGGRCAFNDAASNTGVNLLRAELAPLAREGRFFAEVSPTGSHAASLAAVAVGKADVAAIDCVTLALLGRHDPDLVAAVRVLKWSVACPGLPLITALSTPAEGVLALRRVLHEVAADPLLAEARRALLIDGFSVLPDGLYEQIPLLGKAAAQRGYPALA
ncbi:MAG: PhnD/SsuA/transferrin family substrate-binding protein, partial [Phenylobacterium sp.]